jgi:hypothetical protein
MIVNGLEIKMMQDERMQHVLLVRPATGGLWRVFMRHYSAHVVATTEDSLLREVMRHGWEIDRINAMPVASFRLTRRGRELLEASA